MLEYNRDDFFFFCLLRLLLLSLQAACSMNHLPLSTIIFAARDKTKPETNCSKLRHPTPYNIQFSRCDFYGQ